MFRIDKSSVSYKKSDQPFVLAHAAVTRPLNLPSLDEQPPAPQPEDAAQQETAVETDTVPQPQDPPKPEIQLPDPVKLVEDAKIQAEAIRIQAQVQTQNAIDEAKKQAEQMLAQAKEEGYQQGFAQGEAAGKASFDASIQAARQSIEQLVAGMDAQRNTLFEPLERQCLELSISIAEKILGTMLAVDETAFVSMVKNGLNKIMHEGSVMVRVSTEDYQMFFPDAGRSLSSETLSVHVVEDESLSSGDIRMESAIESVDASAKRQMDTVAAALREAGGA